MNNQNDPILEKEVKEETVKEELQEKQIINEETEQAASTEEQQETVVENEENIIEENLEQKEEELKTHQLIENKKLKITFIKILLYFVLSSVIYIICKAYDPFGNVTTNTEIQSMQLLNYISIVMYISFAVSGLLLVAYILYMCGIKLNLKTKVIKMVIEILDWFAILPICVAVTSLCFTFLFTFTIVDGDSMKPTLNDGEQLLLTYDKNFERFDIVVCEVQSGNERVLYVKRIIGMPGETVEFKSNPQSGSHDLYISGKLVEQPFYESSDILYSRTNQSYLTDHVFNWNEFCFQFRHQLVQNENGEYVIPEGYYFILGDNRRNSRDSRSIGLVSKDDILGQINYRLHSILKYEKLV